MHNNNNLKQIVILIADDDAEDRLLAREAFTENRMVNKVVFVNNGVELMEYLTHTGKYNEHNAPKPDLILLDLNMPKKDGRKALKEIKAAPKLRIIPVVILTSSKIEEDMIKSFEFGISGYISKPVRFEDIVKVTKNIDHYYFGIVKVHER